MATVRSVLLQRLLIVALAVASFSLEARADAVERTVFVSPDGFVTVVSDTALTPAEAADGARRIEYAYDFDRQQERWADLTLVAPPVTMRVLQTVPEGLLGRATAPSTFLIQVDYLRTPGSSATIAHELTHLQDLRELQHKHLPQYWLEGRANSNAFAFRAHLGMGQNPDWKHRVSRWTSAQAKALFEDGTATGPDAHALIEEVGTLWFEHLRRRFPDAHPRSSRMLAAVAAGTSLDDAFAKAFGQPLDAAEGEFLRYLDATQSDPDARVQGTWMEWTSNAGRTPRVAHKQGISAFVEWGNGKAYLFRGKDYTRFDAHTERADPNYPKPIAGNWEGVPWSDGFDAAVNWGNGKVYFFKGDQYLRYDIKADRADHDFPKRMLHENWSGLPWIDGFDAAVNWGNGKALFFKDGEFVSFDIKGDAADPGYPKRIDASFPGMTFGHVDAVLNLGAGKAYFFLGDQYIRFDLAAHRADPGFPQPVAGQWK